MAAPILGVLAIIGATLGHWLQFQRETVTQIILRLQTYFCIAIMDDSSN